MFDIKPGDSVVVLCDKNRGMAIKKAESLEPAIEKFIRKEINNMIQITNLTKNIKKK